MAAIDWSSLHTKYAKDCTDKYKHTIQESKPTVSANNSLLGLYVCATMALCGLGSIVASRFLLS